MLYHADNDIHTDYKSNNNTLTCVEILIQIMYCLDSLDLTIICHC
jgi:hypothetical protein